MKTIVLACQKGGVAKTTTAYTLAAGLYKKGKKVLCVDTDPQANLSFTAGADVVNTKNTLYTVFKGKAKTHEAILKTKTGFDVIIGGLNMTSADMEFMQQGREYMLSEALEEIKENYDYCIIDTAPHMGILTINAMTAANDVIIPITADIYALMGLTQLKGIIDSVKKYSNHNLKIAGLLLTKYNDRTNASKAMYAEAERTAKQFNTKLFKNTIRQATAIQESQILQSDIFTESPAAEVAKDYSKFIEEFLESEEN